MLSTYCLAAVFVKVTIRALASSKLPCINEDQHDREIGGLLELEKITYWRSCAHKGRGGSFLFNINYTSVFREEATSALTDFYAGPVSWLHRNLECWFLRKEENQRIREKPSEQGENQHPGWHQTLAALVGGEQSHHCVIPVPCLTVEGVLIGIGALLKKTS